MRNMFWHSVEVIKQKSKTQVDVVSTIENVIYKNVSSTDSIDRIVVQEDESITETNN